MRNSNMERNVFDTRTARIWLGEDGIARVTISPRADHTLADAQENIAAGGKLAKGSKVPTLVDISRIRSISRDGRRYYSGEETAKIALALALLVASPISGVVGNFFLGFNKGTYPTRLFTSEAEALDWLKGFVE